MSLNKLGEIKDEAGDAIVQMFSATNALTSGDGLDQALYALSETLIRGLDLSGGGGFLGGEFGYGVDFENDVFLMHHFCWCDSDDCLWCGGSCCQVEHFHEPHRAGCYQVRRQLLCKEFGEQAGWTQDEYYTVSLNSPNIKKYDRAIKSLCKEMGQTYPECSDVHCTCGVDGEWRARYDACRCEWHLGEGRFIYGVAAQAPNFWHKPSGFQVSWYKWIGRGMEWNFVPDDPVAIFKECFDSIPRHARDKAQEQHDYENTPEYLAKEREARERMFEHIKIRENCTMSVDDGVDETPTPS